MAQDIETEEKLKAAYERWIVLQRRSEQGEPPLAEGDVNFQVGKVEFTVPAHLETRCRRLAPLIEAWYERCTQGTAYSTVEVIKYKVNSRALAALLGNPCFFLDFVGEKFVKKEVMIIAYPPTPYIDPFPAFNSRVEAEGYITSTLSRLLNPSSYQN